MKVSVLVPTASQRDMVEADDFATAVAGVVGAPVPVIEGSLADAPSDGYVLAFGVPAAAFAEHRELCRRVVLVNASGATVLDSLERFGLVAAIEQRRYYNWLRSRARESGYGLIGRRELAAALDGKGNGSYASEHYDSLESTRYPDLIALLRGYLSAYAADPPPAFEPAAPAAASHTVDDGRIVVGETIEADVTNGFYHGHVAEDPEQRRLITVTAGHEDDHGELRERLALPIDGVTPLEWIGDVDEPEGTWQGDCMVEVEPAGVPVRSIAPISEAAAIGIGAAVARIAARAHAARMVLGGLRPELIYVRGPGDRAEVTAIAPRAIAFIETARRSTVGVPAFASIYERETLTGQPTGAASDVFALCVTLFELVTGSHPFGEPGDQIPRLAAGQPMAWTGSPALGAVLQRGLAADPRQRPTAADLGATLERLRG
jgi:hypothetical protein